MRPGERARSTPAPEQSEVLSPELQGEVERLKGVRLDGAKCAWESDPDCLRSQLPMVLAQNGPELHLMWRFGNSPVLWSFETPDHPPVRAYERRLLTKLPDLRPRTLFRLDSEWFGKKGQRPAAAKPAGPSNREMVLQGRAGRVRSVNCLESHLFAYQATRFSMLDHPTGFTAFILVKRPPGLDPAIHRGEMKVYFTAGQELTPPSPGPALERIEKDLEDGWELHARLHNRTFDFTENTGGLAVTVPGEAEIDDYRRLHARFGLKNALITNGLHTLQVTSDDFGVFRGTDDESAPMKKERRAEDDPDDDTVPRGETDPGVQGSGDR